MKEEQLIEYFDQDLENMHNGNDPKHDGSLPQEYKEALDLAVSLSQLDFSPDQVKRDRKRQQIINDYQYSQQEKQHKFISLSRRTWARPAIAVGAIALVMMLTVSVAFPGKLTAAAGHIARIVHIDKYVTVLLYDDGKQLPEGTAVDFKLREDGKTQPFTGTIAISLPETVTSTEGDILSEGGNLSLSVSPSSSDQVGDQAGENSIVYSTLAAAQKTLSFKLLTPEYLPAGYSFKEAEGFKDAENGQAFDESINLFYKGPGKDIILMQRVLGEDSELSTGTNGKSDSVKINGETGAWLESNSLAWKKAGVVYALSFNGLSQKEALKIARSVK